MWENQCPLTECLSLSTTIRTEETCGCHGNRLVASVAWPWTIQSEILRQFHSLTRCTRTPNSELKGWDSSWRILSPWWHNTTLTAIGNLLIIRGTWEQVHNGRFLLTTVRDISLILGTVSLLCGFCTQHGPYHFFLSPYPSHGPARAHNVPVHLVVGHCHCCLKNHCFEIEIHFLFELFWQIMVLVITVNLKIFFSFFYLSSTWSHKTFKVVLTSCFFVQGIYNTSIIPSSWGRQKIRICY